MKKYLVILTAAFSSFTFISDNPIDRLGVTGPLTFNNTSFNLVWTDKPKDTYYIQEYVPQGEKVENFNQMLTIHLFGSNTKLKNAVQQKVAELNERKKTDPTCNYQVNESPNGKEFIVDFLLGESKDDKMAIVEFNIYRYKHIDLGGKKKGVLIYAYSKREYGDSITAFYNNLRDDRTKLLNEMIGIQMPTVKPNDK